MFCHVSQAVLSVGETVSDTQPHMSADCVNQLLQREVIAIAVNLIRSWLIVKDSEVLHLAVDALHGGLIYRIFRDIIASVDTNSTTKPCVKPPCTDQDTLL
jgi:hypothetical protein